MTLHPWIKLVCNLSISHIFFCQSKEYDKFLNKNKSVYSAAKQGCLLTWCGSVTECLPGMYEVLDSTHSNAEDGEGA